MANTPKPARKKVITNTVRTPGGAKVTVQSNKDDKSKWTQTKGTSYSRTDKPSYDKKGKLVNEALNINKDLKGTKKAVRKGNVAGVYSEGKAKNPVNKPMKEGPSFKKKKP
jgi:hypothetical protein